MSNEKLNLYLIDTDYIKYLQKVDKHVQNNYGDHNNQKPYVGVVVEINDKKYYAPLTSPKDKHKILKKSDPTTFKIISKGKFLGCVLFNNMIPIKDNCIHKIEIKNVKDTFYRELLSKEYLTIIENSKIINHKAKTMYNLVVLQNEPFFSRISVKFKELEVACQNYISNSQFQAQISKHPEVCCQPNSSLLKGWTDIRNGITNGNTIQETEKHDVSEKNALSQTNSQIETTTAIKTPGIKR